MRGRGGPGRGRMERDFTQSIWWRCFSLKLTGADFRYEVSCLWSLLCLVRLSGEGRKGRGGGSILLFGDRPVEGVAAE